MKKWRLIYKIIKQTDMDRLLLFFGCFIIVSAFLLDYAEPSFKNYGNAVWYCIVTVTTVGFGDLAAQTMFGRIISIMLMLIGILVISVITGTILNFYNEITKAKNSEVISELMNQLENLDTLSKEQLKEVSEKVKKIRNAR